MTDAAPSAAIKKTLKLRHLFSIGIGTIIGVAWLMVLGTVLVSSGPLGAALGFIAGAGAMIPIGLCYAELAGALPFAGGEFVYAYQLFGLRWAYFAGICLAFIYIINCVFFAVSVGWLLNVLVPGIEGPVLYTVLGEAVHVGDVVLGSVASLALLAAHWRGAKDAAKLQDFSTYLLVLAACIFVVVGISHGRTLNLQPLLAHSDWAWGYGGVVSALAVTPYFFGGFNAIPQGVSELENESDRRRIASVLAGCLLTSLLFYCLLLFAVAMVLSREQIATFELPVVEAFRVAFKSKWMFDLIMIGGLLGLVAVWNALFFAATRVLFALGRSRLIQPAFGQLGKGDAAPTRAIAFVTLLSILGLFLGKGVLLPVVNVSSTLFAAMYATVSIGVLWHRRVAPTDATGYRVPGGKVLVWMASIFSVGLILVSLLQQWMDAHRKLPPEWLLLLGVGVFGWALWMLSATARGGISEAQRRTIILEQSGL